MKTLTVHEWPPLIGTTPNCMACGIAKQNATIHTPNINLTARDNLDIVCCLYGINESAEYERKYSTIK